MTRALSLGGQTVAASLELAGFDTGTPGVALVETVDPRTRAHTVLVQSAWNVLPREQFRELQRAYPARMRARAVARRQATLVNLRRAQRIVCLTEAMARLVRDHAGRTVEVAPVSLPLDALHRRSERPTERRAHAVIPGTITWYKRPAVALDWLAERPELGVREALFLGLDDGSGCRQHLTRRGDQLGLTCRFDIAGRDELYDALATAEVVLLPSALESLGFGLAEALWMTERVVASELPAHSEVATRLGGRPVWLGEAGWAGEPATVDPVGVCEEWENLGETLGLARD